jgi:hypothetical protein
VMHGSAIRNDIVINKARTIQWRHMGCCVEHRKNHSLLWTPVLGLNAMLILCPGISDMQLAEMSTRQCAVSSFIHIG